MDVHEAGSATPSQLLSTPSHDSLAPGLMAARASSQSVLFVTLPATGAQLDCAVAVVAP